MAPYNKTKTYSKGNFSTFLNGSKKPQSKDVFNALLANNLKKRLKTTNGNNVNYSSFESFVKDKSESTFDKLLKGPAYVNVTKQSGFVHNSASLYLNNLTKSQSLIAEITNNQYSPLMTRNRRKNKPVCKVLDMSEIDVNLGNTVSLEESNLNEKSKAENVQSISCNEDSKENNVQKDGSSSFWKIDEDIRKRYPIMVADLENLQNSTNSLSLEKSKNKSDEKGQDKENETSLQNVSILDDDSVFLEPKKMAYNFRKREKFRLLSSTPVDGNITHNKTLNVYDLSEIPKSPTTTPNVTSQKDLLEKSMEIILDWETKKPPPQSFIPPKIVQRPAKRMPRLQQGRIFKRKKMKKKKTVIPDDLKLYVMPRVYLKRLSVVEMALKGFTKEESLYSISCAKSASVACEGGTPKADRSRFVTKRKRKIEWEPAREISERDWTDSSIFDLSSSFKVHENEKKCNSILARRPRGYRNLTTRNTIKEDVKLSSVPVVLLEKLTGPQISQIKIEILKQPYVKLEKLSDSRVVTLEKERESGLDSSHKCSSACEHFRGSPKVVLENIEPQFVDRVSKNRSSLFNLESFGESHSGKETSENRNIETEINNASSKTYRTGSQNRINGSVSTDKHFDIICLNDSNSDIVLVDSKSELEISNGESTNSDITDCNAIVEQNIQNCVVNLTKMNVRLSDSLNGSEQTNKSNFKSDDTKTSVKSKRNNSNRSSSLRLSDSDIVESSVILKSRTKSGKSAELNSDDVIFNTECTKAEAIEVQRELINRSGYDRDSSGYDRHSSGYDPDSSASVVDVSCDFKAPLPNAKKFVALKGGKSFRRSLAVFRRTSILGTPIVQKKDSKEHDTSGKKLGGRLSIRVVPTTPKAKNCVTLLESYARGSSSYVATQLQSEIIFEDHLEDSVKSLSLNNNSSGGNQLRRISHQHSVPRNNNDLVFDEQPLPAPAVTAKDIVLRRCDQTELLAFEKCYPQSKLKNCQKLGEGVFGEVFLFREPNGGTTVMKIIPIEGDQIVNDEHQKKYEQIISEVIITSELSNLRNKKKNYTTGFCEVKNVRLVKGRYPDKLLELWDLYDENKHSENDSPEMFSDDQQYLVLELANAGTDLEAFLFKNSIQAVSLVQQLMCSLAVAENELQFEHRDLHWGNVLVTKVDAKDDVVFRLDGREIAIATEGVVATIIDFTLSRIEYEGVVIFNDLSQDDDLFGAKGDYQFEIYRLMQKENRNNWQTFEPYTNLLWLHYVLDKTIKMVRYQYPKSKAHKNSLGVLQRYKDDILNYKSVTEFVNKNMF